MSLIRQGIYEEARKKIYVPNDANPSRAISITIYNIATALKSLFSRRMTMGLHDHLIAEGYLFWRLRMWAEKGWL